MKIDSIFSTFDKKLECISVHLDSSRVLTSDNNSMVILAYQSYTRLLIDIHGSEDPVYLWGTVSSFYTCVRTVPLLILQDTLNQIHEYFIIHDESDWEYEDFKDLLFSTDGSCVVNVGRLVWAFLANVVKKVFRREDFALINLATACKFFSKLQLDLPELEQDCIKSYYLCEERLLNYSSPSRILVSGMNAIIKDWFRDYNPTFLPVKHGSGSVADCLSTKVDKYHHLFTDKKLDLGIGWLHGYMPEAYYPYDCSGSLVRTSKYITVPKSLTKRRGISMEPATLQYFQQGVMITLYDYIKRYLPQIPLRDQGTNQTGAFLGSKFSYYCTIDLSNASDLVGYQLVKDLFHGTHLLKYLMCTRSDHTLMPDKTQICLNKFAPMGSALCFPTESIVFAACCEFIKRHARSRWDMDDTTYSVYGDDIIINNSLYNATSLALSELGFVINHDKSFHTGPFRESCGKEYHNGIDVTPMKYRLTVKSFDNISPENYAAMCSTVNSAAQRGYFQLRKFLLKPIIRGKLGPLFRSDFGFDPGIWSPQPTNFNNKIRWNRDYQRAEVTYRTVKTRIDRSLIQAEQDANFNPDDALYLERLIAREYFPDQLSEHEISKYSLDAKITGYGKAKALL